MDERRDFTSFSTVFVISGRWESEDDMLCAMYRQEECKMIFHEWSFHMEFMKRGFGEFHKFHII